MKYNVHLYVAARVKFEGIEASSQEEAIAKASELGVEQFFHSDDATEGAVWDEGAHLGALVDEQGDEGYSRSLYHSLGGWSIFGPNPL